MTVVASMHDVVVLGGGPAGCAAATLLARRGHDVALVVPERPPAAELAESVPPSARRILEELGMLEAVEDAGFHANRGNVVWWGGAPVRREDFASEGAGFHVDRASLESVLQAVAQRAGVRCLRGWTARRCEEGLDAADGGTGPGRDDQARWRMSCDSPEGPRELRTDCLVDATGRHGLLARAEGREPDRSTTTLALVRRWRVPGGWPDPHHTLVESWADGWAWSVPLGAETRCFTAMIDQRRVRLEGSDVGAMLDGELGRADHLARMLRVAEPVGDAWACPASLYTARRFGRPGLLLAGDAGSFIDPLSSFGVKKALSSGWMAGVVAHTTLVDPQMRGPALDFFDRRERAVYRAYRRASVPFFEEAAEVYGSAYWRERAAAARRAGEPAGAHGLEAGGPRDHVPAEAGGRADEPSAGWKHADADDPDRLDPTVPEARVREAFEGIRSRPELSAVPGATLRRLERPAIEGHRIVLRDHLAGDAFPAGLRWVRGVDLLALVEVAPRHPDVPDGWAAYNAVATPVPLPDYLTALATAFAAGFLEHGDG